MNEERSIDWRRRKSSAYSDGLVEKRVSFSHCKIRVYPCLSVVLIVLLTAGCGTIKSNSIDSAPNQMARHLWLKKQEKLEISYLLYLPKGFDAKGKKRLPLILFLHSAVVQGAVVW